MLKFERFNMTAGTEHVFDLNSQFCTILNVGEGNLYIELDNTATTNSLLIPAGFGRSFYFPHVVKKVHMVTDGDSLVQIDNLK